MSHLLEIDNLTVYYGYVNALTDVSIHVDKGEIITLIGSNGAGKTTTLMSVSGMVDKAGGKVFYNGQDITKTAPDRIVKLGIAHVPEGRKIFPQLTVYENLISVNHCSKEQSCVLSGKFLWQIKALSEPDRSAHSV